MKIRHVEKVGAMRIIDRTGFSDVSGARSYESTRL